MRRVAGLGIVLGALVLACALPGRAAAASASPSSINYGSVPINLPVSQSVTITVDAGYRTEVASGSGLNAPFSFDFGACGAGGGFTGPGTCTISETFTPTSVASFSGTTNVFECPVAGGTCIGIPFSVQGQGVSLASASPGTVNFGNVPINTSVTQNVSITVDRGYRTEVASGSGLNAPFKFDFDTCGAGGGFTGPGTCNVKESFSPTTVGGASGTTNVFECPIIGGTCIGIPFNDQGTGVSTASASPGTVNFGNVPINTTATQNVSITVDTGYRTEVASGSGLNAPFKFDFDTCGAGGGFSGPGTCNVKESFSPTTLGAASGTTNVFECPIIGGTCIGIPFNDQGTGVSTATANPASVDFGNVPINTTASRDVSITVDAGYRTEVASGSGLNAPFAFDFDTCGTGGGFTGPGTCNVKERYTPTTLTHTTATTNVFECPIIGGTCIGIPFNDQGTGVSTATANPASVDFGNVPINTTASRDVSITVDAGYRTEVASGSGLNAPFAFDFDTCGAGGGFTGPGTCNVKERYTPTTLTHSTATTNVFECPIIGGTCIGIPFNDQGTGVSTASANPAGLDFGNVPINTTASRDVSITVDAGYSIDSASSSGAPFAFDFDTCGTGGGFTGPGTCTAKETFSPTTLGAASGTTNVFECPSVGRTCIGIPFNYQGTGVSAFAASPASVDFGGAAINVTSNRSVALTVDAGYTLSSTASGTATGAPFGFAFGSCAASRAPGAATPRSRTGRPRSPARAEP